MSTAPNDPNNQKPDFDRTTSPNASQRAKPLTGMVIVLPILLLGGLLWFNRSAGPEVEVVKDAPGFLPTPADPAETPVPTPTSGGDGERGALKSLIAYLPNDDAKLVRKLVPAPTSKPGAPGASRGVWADLALSVLFSEGASYFPTGTHPVAPVKAEGDVLTVDMNKAYATKAESWSSAESATRVMSLVNTVAATDEQLTGKRSSVRILVEGKKIGSLGEYDAGEPIEPDYAPVPKP